VKGSVIVYKPGHLIDAQVVQKYFPNLRMIQAPQHALTSAPVAVFVTGAYQPQPVGSSGTPTTCITPSG